MKKYKVDTIENLKKKFTALSSQELVDVGSDLNKSMIPFLYNFDNDFFVENPREGLQMQNKVPYMIGNCDAEYGWLLPTVMQSPSEAPKNAVLDMIKKPLAGHMDDKQATSMAAAIYDGMSKVYAKHSPFSENSDSYHPYILRRALADQWFHGAYLRTEDICNQQPVFCYQLSVQTKAHHTAGAKPDKPVKPDWVNADHGDCIMYVFGIAFQGSQLMEGKFTDDEIALQKRMMKCWTDFAKNGNPGWEQYNSNSKIIKDFNCVDSIMSGNDQHWNERTEYTNTNLIQSLKF